MQGLQVLIKSISDKFGINFILLKKLHFIEIQLDFYYLKELISKDFMKSENLINYIELLRS